MGSQAVTVMEASDGQEAKGIALSVIILAHVYIEEGKPAGVYRDL